MPTPRTLEWIGDADGFVRLIDQTQLPATLAYRDCRTVEDVWEAIRVLRVRGAPAIGVAAAMGVVVGVQGCTEAARYGERLREVTAYLRTSRPTAVNLFWALERMERCFERECSPPYPPQNGGVGGGRANGPGGCSPKRGPSKTRTAVCAGPSARQGRISSLTVRAC